MLYFKVQTYCASFVANQYVKEKTCRFEMAKLMTLPTGYFHWSFKKGEPNIQLYSKGYFPLSTLVLDR